jgi:hypothetical protein
MISISECLILAELLFVMYLSINRIPIDIGVFAGLYLRGASHFINMWWIRIWTIVCSTLSSYIAIGHTVGDLIYYTTITLLSIVLIVEYCKTLYIAIREFRRVYGR